MRVEACLEPVSVPLSRLSSLELGNHCPFRATSSRGNRKMWGGDRSRECGGCCKAVTLCLARRFVSRNKHFGNLLLTTAMHVQIFVNISVITCNRYCYFR
jgi:hypothetical protein